MGNKLHRIVQTIEILVTEMNAFGFKYQQQTPTSKQWQQTDSIIVDPENIVSQSRYEEKQKIVKILTDPANSATITVLPIVGMGGLGKTTLAQLIYNDLQVQKHFQIKRWICVSDDFNVYGIARKICNGPGENDNEKALHKLQQKLSGKRYLLVLDDVWNRDPDKWDKLKACLQYGGIGSAILVTTRIKGIAQLMSTVEAHDIAVLEKKFITQIFETRAFSLPQSKPACEILNMVDAPELLNMVQKFVERCGGSPLAAKALGSVLHTKTSLEEWSAVLNKSIICTEESEILQILKLSYDDLPSTMKQCFAFCAVFPKDYVICVDKLIQLWIANGFIQEQEGVRLETIGKQIFNELASRSFFQNVKQVLDEKNQDYSRVTCEIHDLMHDVALSTMRKECATVTEKPSRTQWLPESARHLFLSCRKPETILNDSLKRRSPAIQTLLCDSYMECSLQHLSKYSSLQALQLYIRRESFPLNPKYLHHLRYLDLSRSCIRALPEDITILYNLKTLNLFGCKYRDRLPRKMSYMTALCHIYTHGCSELKSMPPDLRKLTSLQTLTCFIAGTGSYCSNVGELQHFNLGGQLELLQLENVTEADAKTANLVNKKELVELTLRWTFGREEQRHYHKVLEGLKPHEGMHVIRIYSYGGTNFPTWMGMLQNIHLFHCKKLQCLFNRHTSFTFPKLKELTLEHLPVFERWWERNGRQGENIIFPQLEKLIVKHCGMLIHLLEAPLLEKPCGGDYAMIYSTFPVLKLLELEYLERFQGWEKTERTQGEHVLFPRLEKLSIQKCPELIALPEATGDHTAVRSAFPALKVLELEDLKSFQRWEAAKRTQGVIMFPHLLKLSLQKCPELIELPAAPLLGNPCAGHFNMARSAFPALMVLELEDLKSFQKWQAGKVTQGEQIAFPRLEKLSIKTCPELTALPAGTFQGRSFAGNDMKEWSAFPELKELQLYDLKSF
uniref:Uncharacterized protein n=1 Tax=Avena sativa TaxID=4498 RepID=A0ACD5ZXG0_AVESA